MNNQTETTKADKKNTSKQSVDDSKQQLKEQLMTPEHNIVDVFEFEPVGFMSNGRW